MKLLLTCEHAGNEIPQEYQRFFEGAEEVLSSHRGFDPGAFDLFKKLSSLADFENHHEVSRLLVEPNRSLHHPQLFSEFTESKERDFKKEILEKYYFPHRNVVEQRVRDWTESGENVLHLSVHSFTPVLNGEVRKADIGLLFDPARASEKNFCRKWKETFQQDFPQLKVRFNYPYLGKADGFTTYLRKKFPKNYSGIELEVNQKFVQNNEMDAIVKNAIFNSFHKCIRS